MKRTIKSIGVAILGLALLAGVALAAYSADIVVTEDGTASYDMVGCNASTNIQYMADNNFFGSTGLDTRVLLNTVAQPHMLAEDRLMFAIPVRGNSSQTLQFTTGSANLSNYYIIPGYDGYITAADNATLELSDNFTYQTIGWVDTDAGVDKDLIYKPFSFATFVSPDVSGNVTAAIYGTANATEVLRPDGHVQCLLPDEAGAACNDHYQNVNSVAVNDATWNGIATAADDQTDIYSLQDSSNITNKNSISSVTATIRGKEGLDGYFWVGLKLGASTTWGTQRTPGLVFTTYHETLARPGGGDWTVSDINNLQIMCRAKGDAGTDSVWITWAYITVNFNYETVTVQVTATGVSSGEHTVTVVEEPLIWATDDVLQFESVINSLVNCGPLYNASPKLWISVWFKLDTLFDSTAPENLRIWGKRPHGANFIYLELTKATGKLGWYHYNGGWLVILTTAQTSWNADQWYHVIASISDVSGARVRVDNGVALTDADVTAAPDAGDFVIGMYNTPGGVTGFEGNIANFVVGIDDLTLAEETDLYNGIPPGDEDNLWYLDEGTGTTIYSYGASDNTGIAGAANSWGQSVRPCKFAVSIDDTPEGGFARPISVPDNSENWTFMAGNSVLYSDNITLDIGGNRQLYYYPDDIIAGVILPDIQGADHDGTFVWGSGNPTGVSVEIGSMISGYVPTITAPSLETVDVVPVMEEPGDMYVSDVDVAATILTDPLYTWFHTWSDVTGIDILLMYWMFYLLAAIIVFMFVYKFSKNLFISGAMFVGVIGYGVDRELWPFWLVLVLIMILLGFVTMERRQQL